MFYNFAVKWPLYHHSLSLPLYSYELASYNAEREKFETYCIICTNLPYNLPLSHVHLSTQPDTFLITFLVFMDLWTFSLIGTPLPTAHCYCQRYEGRGIKPLTPQLSWACCEIPGDMAVRIRKERDVRDDSPVSQLWLSERWPGLDPPVGESVNPVVSRCFGLKLRHSRSVMVSLAYSFRKPHPTLTTDGYNVVVHHSALHREVTK